MIAVFAFAVGFVALLALLAYVHASAYPHIDDVLAELGEDSGLLDPRNLAEKNASNKTSPCEDCVDSCDVPFGKPCVQPTPPAITGTVGIVIRHRANR